MPAPPPVTSACASLAATRAVAVLCPRELPRGRWQVGHRSLMPGGCAYLLDLETTPFGSGDAFHVLAGGRCGRFSLRTRDGRWPAGAVRAADLDRYLRLLGVRPLKPGQRPGTEGVVRARVLGRTTVHRHRALVVRMPAYPAGGLHGGHVGVVWTQGSASYVLTLHPGRATGPLQARRLAVSAARATARTP